MNLSCWAAIALATHLASRLAYVLYIGIVLARQERTGYFTQRYGAEDAFRRFRRVATVLMASDGASFVFLCVVTQNTFWFELPRSVAISAGVLLVLVGVLTKLWAAATLGGRAYYWHDFFTPAERAVPNSTGPYRFLKNPMYTVGYLQTYGFALVTGSLVGILAALLDQAAIIAFYRLVEKPHFERLLKS